MADVRAVVAAIDVDGTRIKASLVLASASALERAYEGVSGQRLPPRRSRS